MTLTEIFVQLPPNMAQHLEELLEVAEVPDNPTREEVLEVAYTMATELRFGVVGITFDGDEQTLKLLDLLPQAIVDQLF